MAEWLDRRALRLTPLSPIHIGAGDSFDWTRSVLDTSASQVVVFDSGALQFGESQRRKLEALGEKALLNRLDPADFIKRAQQFFKSEIGAVRQARESSHAIMPGVLRRLDELTGMSARADKKAVQAMAIEKAMADPRSGRPVVPGSGVKGALRTAWIDNAGSALVDDRAEPKGKFDPFSQIAVEDFSADAPIRSGIVLARNVKRDRPAKAPNASGLPIRVEAILPSATVSFVGALRGRRTNPDAHWIGLETLLEYARRFHVGHWKEQLQQMRDLADGWWMDAMDRLIPTLPGEAVLLRLGKLCSAESKTVERREIQVRAPRKEKRRHGTTFWLAGDEGEARGLPFGWALLEPAENHGRAADLLEGFRRHAPWRDLRLDAPAARPPVVEPSGPNVTQAAPEPWRQTILDLQTKLERGQLSEDYLKSAVNQALRFDEAAHRAAVREWIAGHYKQVIRQAYRHRNFETFLAKLK